MKLLVIGSIILSILASILFYGQNLGVSVILFVTAILGMLIYILEKCKKIKNRKAYILVIPIFLLAATYFIYNQEFFKVINLAALIILVAIMILWAILGKLEDNTFITKCVTLIFVPVNYITQASKELIHTIFPKREKEKKENTQLKQICIGIGISIPILIVVLRLLSSADMIFAQGINAVTGNLDNIIQNFINNNTVINLIMRFLFICITTIYFIAFVLNLWNKQLLNNSDTERKVGISVEVTIFNTLVTILNIVYAIFCTIQITTLFAKIVPENFNYAEYARQGFFQLMFISVINFAIILLTSTNKNKATNKQRIYAKIMNILLTIFTFIILISAFVRMNLYQQEYGFTFLRIFVDFALITESILLFPTLIYIIKPSFKPLKYYVTIIITIYIIMNYANIAQLIAKENVNRYIKEQKDVDIYYLTKTKTDGLKEVLELYEKTEDSNLKLRIERYLYTLKLDLNEKDNWMEWNYSRWYARKLLEPVNVRELEVIEDEIFRQEPEQEDEEMEYLFLEGRSWL